jgi:3'(2'), 5'-bisphosphate nucleotidase
MLEQELDAARTLARKAGKVILEVYATDFESEQKLSVDDHYEPVTAADRLASRVIVDGLADAFPADAILSEEEKDDLESRLRSNRTWIIDPVDGTAGFVKRDGDFAVQIGLAEKGEAVLGVVFMPIHDVLMYAARDGGAFAEVNEQEQTLSVSDKTAFSELGLAISRHHPSKRMGQIIEAFGFTSMIQRGSVGLKVGLIAEQRCDVYIHPGTRTKIWDTCAPEAILRAAGGRMTDLFGRPIRYDALDVQNHDGIVATNGAVHAAVIDRLKPLLTEFGRVPHTPMGRTETTGA